ASAQDLERYAFSGDDVAVYNLAGEVRLEAGTGPGVVVELVRGGDDARELRVEHGPIDGRQTLRVIYPSDRIVYPGMSRGSRTNLRVRSDGTFHGDRDGGERVTIAGSGGGLEAYADVRVRVPEGKRIAVHLGAGDVVVTSVNGEVLVDAGTSSIEATGTRGLLWLDTGSGRVSVRDAEGEVDVDTGSGSVEVYGIRGRRLRVDTGSGRVRGGEVAVDDLDVDTGSGSIDLDGVRAGDVRLDTGSGSVRLALLDDVTSLDIDTGSGGVTLSVPASLSARLELDTGSGGIDVDLPLQVLRSARDYLLAQAGQGTGSIRVETGSGGIRVRRN
ncbi:MAG: DUF4097 family beta strand repeat protein, partial [Actinobacteria bacterium]|nr:DUF4097 family beta strand repeat protein [Actinomycetota bacterium]NIS28509.1 DUF4097 family beta strand repeat protein [Actinomycetota bacterium]NIU63980.1 DUF4097 family beta strand repeat protein [Actinomycetota bacterium]NIW25778.1 DUF4097 family beta strand repeat protein [Actinomycetota bacterium]NIX18386.1 DUF4097 family beta strand repeat protein [Actinomycetota bacterium]